MDNAIDQEIKTDSNPAFSGAKLQTPKNAPLKVPERGRKTVENPPYVVRIRPAVFGNDSKGLCLEVVFVNEGRQYFVYIMYTFKYIYIIYLLIYSKYIIKSCGSASQNDIWFLVFYTLHLLYSFFTTKL